MKNWYSITNKSETSAEVCIYEEIGSYGITAKAFLDEIKNIGNRKITLRINSPGGEVFEGLAIYNRLREHPGGVEVKIDGIAASMASVIAMAGAPVTMAANALLMVHNPSGLCVGNSADMRELADMLDKVRGSLTGAYERKTGKSAEEICAMMDAETWLNADEALAAGFCDEITGELKLAASVGKLALSGKLADREKTFDKVLNVHELSTSINKMTEPTSPEVPATPPVEPAPAAPVAVAPIASATVTITASADELRAEGAAQERQRIADIRAWAGVVAKVQKIDISAAVDAHVANGKSLAEFKEHVITNTFKAEPISTPTDTTGAQGNTMSREAFSKLSPFNQSEFCKKGGKLTD